MKKLISIVLIGIIIGINILGISYGQDVNYQQNLLNTVQQATNALTTGEKAEQHMSMCSDKGGSPMYDFVNKTCTCTINNETYPCESVPEQITGTGGNNTGNTYSPKSVWGISCSEAQLLNGQCKLNVYDTLGIRKTVRNEDDPTSVGLFVQDVVLSATFFIGTVVTVALIVSGLMYIFAAGSGKDPANAKKGIVGALIGLLLVVSSYVIIRLVQYIAKGF